jgi:predicted RNA-binding protein with PUA-like domain
VCFLFFIPKSIKNQSKKREVAKPLLFFCFTCISCFSFPNPSKIHQKSTKMDPKSTKIEPKWLPKPIRAPRSILDARNGAKMDPKWPPGNQKSTFWLKMEVQGRILGPMEI